MGKVLPGRFFRRSPPKPPGLKSKHGPQFLKKLGVGNSAWAIDKYTVRLYIQLQMGINRGPKAESSKTGYTMGEFAELMGLSHRTIDFYTREGLLHPQQSGRGRGYRHYTEEDRQRVILIKQFQARKFSLQDIRNVLNSNDLKKTPSAMEALEKINFDLERLRGLVQETKSSAVMADPAIMRVMATEALQKATGLCSLLIALLQDKPF